MNNWHRSGMIFFDEILADKKLSITAKMIAGKILSLTNCGENECFLPNSFICKTFCLSINSAKKAIADLENQKFIKTTFKYNSNNSLIRHVSWVYGVSTSNTLSENDPLSKNDKGGYQKMTEGVSENDTKYKNINIRKEYKNENENEYEREHAPQKTESENLNKNNSDSESEKIETVEAEVLDNKKNSDGFNSFESEKSNTLILPTKCKDFNKGQKPKPLAVATIQAYIEAFVGEHQAEKPNLTRLNLEYTAENFYEYYEEREWYQGKYPLKDWRRAANRWLNTAIQNLKPPSQKTFGERFEDNKKFFKEDYEREARERQQLQQAKQPELLAEPF